MNLTSLITVAQITQGAQILGVILWGMLAVGLTAALVVLGVTRWGRAQPMRICIVLSLLVHVLLAGYAATVEIVAGSHPGRPPETFEVTLIDADDTYDAQPKDEQAPKPWEPLAGGAIMQPEVAQPSPMPADTQLMMARLAADDLPSLLQAAAPIDVPLTLPEASAADIPRVRRGESLEAPQPIDAPAPQKEVDTATIGPVDEPPARAPLDDGLEAVEAHRLSRTANRSRLEQSPSLELPEMELPEAQREQPAASITRSITSAPPATLADVIGPRPGGEMGALNAVPGGTSEGGDATQGPEGPLVAIRRAETSGTSLPGVPHELPSIYKLRVAPDRSEAARRHGGTQQTEAAVEAGLAWLARNQSDDGRWNPARLEGGRGIDLDGRNRDQTGANADTGITALAILAFNGAGYTHREGKYRATVTRGLNYLIAAQRSDGYLGGDAELYARMYCHGMATFALSESYAMTGDEALRPAVKKGVGYTLRAQNPRTGGWRYRPGDDGDMSQLGWQVMALKSAELAGIEVPENARAGSLRFVASVSSGKHGELAAYRPGQGPSRPMTAEALVCRQFLADDTSLIGSAAAAYITEDRPGMNKANLYYWYYATLGLYRMQGEAWEAWNKSLQQELVATQVQHGDAAGSWSPDTVWGGHGGRAYTTAMATLCLEVYYRFLPLYEAEFKK